MPVWYVFLGLACATACAFILFISKSPLSSQEYNTHAPGLLTLLLIVGWVGSRAFSLWFEDMRRYGVGEFILLALQPGDRMFYGGTLCMAFVLEVYIWVFGLKKGIWRDAVTLGGVLGLGIGRLGCFLNGDDFGRVVEGGARWWTVTRWGAGEAFPRYPTQGEEALVAFAVVIGGGWAYRQTYVTKAYKGSPGALSGVCLVVISLNRFINEFYRGDPRGVFPYTSFSFSQIIALGVVGALALKWVAVKGR
jgi:phosphatidylglycerol---prolipoprotein diacylglyceryl transferase